MSQILQPPDAEESKTVNDRLARKPMTHEPPKPVPVPGQRLVNRYAVLKLVGEGGMGVVLAAYDEQLDRRVALKLLRQACAENSTLEARLVREAQAMARLSHPNVVAVYDSGRLEDGTFFIAMEYVAGVTLQDWCQQQRSWREVLGAYVEAGQGLAAAHAVGLIHRDFKPANVLVGRDGRVRVTDFGVARLEASSALDSWVSRPLVARKTPLTLPGHVVGTPYYLAPELLNEQPADGRSDLFSFCVALYEALYGQPPFAGATANERMRARLEGRLTPPPEKTQVPAWVGRAVMQGLGAEPQKRPASMQALLATLQNDPEVRKRNDPEVRKPSEGGLDRCPSCAARESRARKLRKLLKGLLQGFLPTVGAAFLVVRVAYPLIRSGTFASPPEPGFDYGRKALYMARLRDQLAEKPCDRPTVVEYVQALFSANNWRGSIQSTDNFISRCGKFPQLRSVTYSAHMRLSEYSLAVQDATELIESAPDNPGHWVWRAMAYDLSKAPDMALADFEKAFSLKPEQFYLADQLASAYERQRRHCDAHSVLLEHLKANGALAGQPKMETRLLRLMAEGKCTGKPDTRELKH